MVWVTPRRYFWRLNLNWFRVSARYLHADFSEAAKLTSGAIAQFPRGSKWSPKPLRACTHAPSLILLTMIAVVRMFLVTTLAAVREKKEIKMFWNQEAYQSMERAIDAAVGDVERARFSAEDYISRLCGQAQEGAFPAQPGDSMGSDSAAAAEDCLANDRQGPRSC